MELRTFKDNVKAAAEYLARAGIEVPHAQMLEAISRVFGERNWSTMRALLDEKSKAEAPKADALQAEAPQEQNYNWMPGVGLMPDGLYVKYHGCRCPSCGSNEVESDSLDADVATATANAACRDCGAIWTDIWTLTGYDNFAPEEDSDEDAMPDLSAMPGLTVEYNSIWDDGCEVDAPAKLDLATGKLTYIADSGVDTEELGLCRCEEEVIDVVVEGKRHRFTVIADNGGYSVSRQDLAHIRQLVGVVFAAASYDERIVESIVEKVRHYAREYAFTIDSAVEADSHAREAAGNLGLDFSEADIAEAVKRLI